MLGFVWGVGVTWASVYAVARIHWPTKAVSGSACNDMEHCASHAAFVTGLFASLLWPAAAFAVLNGVAYKRWSGRKWGAVFCVVTILVELFYLAPHVASTLGLVR